MSNFFLEFPPMIDQEAEDYEDGSFDLVVVNCNVLRTSHYNISNVSLNHGDGSRDSFPYIISTNIT